MNSIFIVLPILTVLMFASSKTAVGVPEQPLIVHISVFKIDDGTEAYGCEHIVPLLGGAHKSGHRTSSNT